MATKNLWIHGHLFIYCQFLSKFNKGSIKLKFKILNQPTLPTTDFIPKHTIRRKNFDWIKAYLDIYGYNVVATWTIVKKGILLRLKALSVTFKNPFTIEWMQWALSLKVYILACVVMIALWMDETEEWWSDANHLWCARAAAQCTLLQLLH